MFFSFRIFSWIGRFCLENCVDHYKSIPHNNIIYSMKQPTAEELALEKVSGKLEVMGELEELEAKIN